jgi:hypothetical protein
MDSPADYFSKKGSNFIKKSKTLKEKQKKNKFKKNDLNDRDRTMT